MKGEVAAELLDELPSGLICLGGHRLALRSQLVDDGVEMRTEEFIDVGLAPHLNAASLVELGNEFGGVADGVDLLLQGLGVWPSRLTGWPKLIWVPC